MAETNQGSQSATSAASTTSTARNSYKLRDFRHKSFDSGVKGVDPITHEGTEVPKTKENDVLEAAKKQGVEIVKVDEDANPE